MKKKLLFFVIFILVLSFANVFAANPTIKRNFKTDIYRDYPDVWIRNITITNTLPSVSRAYDLSELGDSSVKGYVSGPFESDEGDYYTLVIGGVGGISTPSNATELFKDFNCETISGWQYMNTSNTTIMTSMFEGCNRMTNINLQYLDMSHVTKADRMFYQCGKFAESFTFTGMDNLKNQLSNVTDTSYMFSDIAISNLNLKGFNFSNVEKAINMFAGSYIYGTLTLEDCNFSKLKFANYMFVFYKNIQGSFIFGYGEM